MPSYQDELAQTVDRLNRAAPATRGPRPGTGQGNATLDQLLVYATRHSASDLLPIVDAPVILRVNGALSPVAGQVLTADDTRNLLLPHLTATQYEELQRNRSVDLCFTRDGIGRFRGNVHHQRGTLAGSIQLLPEKIPTLESLHLPATLKRLADARQGLILVTGPTGCGKSPTLAALLDPINAQRRGHIVTIEDPVEFVHTNRNSVVEQIEVGHDAVDFAGAARSILRQTPDVILVGEMRDAETMTTVLTAAETGHLVLSTLHTNGASQGHLAHSGFLPGGEPATDPSAAIAGAAGHRRTAACSGRGRGRPIPGARNHDRQPCCAQSDSKGRRSPDLYGHRNRASRGDDYDGTAACGDGSDWEDFAETAFAHCFRVEDLRRYLQE